MGSGTVIKYPLDLTGNNPDNLITGELHQFSVLGQKAFVLNYGPFYAKSLVVKNADTGQTLTPRAQYVATQLMVDMTLRTGKDVCSIIVITDESLPDNLRVLIDYQVLGGPYSSSVDAIQQLIDALDLGNAPIHWKQILGKPVSFPPAPHLHDVGDVYGFEYVVAAMERLVQAIYLGDQEQFDSLYSYIDHQDGLLQDGIDGTNAALLNHVNDNSNPHGVTKAQVGLPLVENFQPANQQEAEEGVTPSRYMTPKSTKWAIDHQALIPLDNHKNNKSNPHEVTKTQVGLELVENYAVATKPESEQGLATNKYMTPKTTKWAIDYQAGRLINQLINQPTFEGPITGSGADLVMATGNKVDNGDITVSSIGVGDEHMAGMTFANDSYMIKMGVRDDGVFGIGGADSSTWRWYNRSNGDTYQTGDCYIYSDPRLKENVQVIDNPLDKIEKINGYSYNWKVKGPKVNQNGKRDYGVLSTEIKEIMPELVTAGLEVDGVVYDTVSYDKLIPLLIESIKALNKKINTGE